MTTTTTALRIAVIGVGPAGLLEAETHALAAGRDTYVDLYERRPAPFGLLAYGTCPRLRLLGNVEVGHDIDVAELREYYDAVIDTTGDYPPPSPAPRRHPDASAVLNLLRSRHIPFTTWETPGRERGETNWNDVLTRARAVPVCDQ